MTLTVEERREINRANSKKSTGPKTEAGKARSRVNSFKHGFCARTLALPNEDPAVVAALASSWDDYYRPQSPGAQQLVNACVRASLQSDRLARYHDSAISSQVRQAEESWDNARIDEFESLKSLLNDDPALAVRLLRRKSLGCEYMAGRWSHFVDLIATRGFWFPEECDEVIRLTGVDSDAAGLKSSVDAFSLYFFNALSETDDPRRTALEKLDPRYCPDSLWKRFKADAPPDRTTCQKWMYQYCRSQAHTFTTLGKTLQETLEAPDRAGAQDRALVLKDKDEARLYLRYNSEARTAFHRAFGTLVKTLEADKARAEDEVSDDSRNEADDEALEMGGEPRNEAGSEAEEEGWGEYAGTTEEGLDDEAATFDEGGMIETPPTARVG